MCILEYSPQLKTEHEQMKALAEIAPKRAIYLSDDKFYADEVLTTWKQLSEIWKLDKEISRRTIKRINFYETKEALNHLSLVGKLHVREERYEGRFIVISFTDSRYLGKSFE